MYLLKKGIQNFAGDGIKAAKSELKQIHERTCWRAMAVAELTRRDRQRAMECLMFLTEKSQNK